MMNSINGRGGEYLGLIVRVAASAPGAPRPFLERINTTISCLHLSHPVVGPPYNIDFHTGARNPNIQLRKLYHSGGNLGQRAVCMVAGGAHG